MRILRQKKEGGDSWWRRNQDEKIRNGRAGRLKKRREEGLGKNDGIMRRWEWKGWKKMVIVN